MLNNAQTQAHPVETQLDEVVPHPLLATQTNATHTHLPARTHTHAQTQRNAHALARTHTHTCRHTGTQYWIMNLPRLFPRNCFWTQRISTTTTSRSSKRYSNTASQSSVCGCCNKTAPTFPSWRSWSTELSTKGNNGKLKTNVQDLELHHRLGPTFLDNNTMLTHDYPG